jgi:ribose 1,5-bisphosphokinase PhnN
MGDPVSPTLVYIVGPPGSGKSSLMAALTGRCRRMPRSGALPHDTLYRPNIPPQPATIVGAEIGRIRDSFSGTDALSMSIQPRAVEWISGVPEDLVLGEGARLGNVGFLSAARAAGYDVHLVYLTASPSTLLFHRTQRDSTQSERWMRGGETRARRVVERMEADVTVHRLASDDLTPEELAVHLTGRIPALEVLR